MNPFAWIRDILGIGKDAAELEKTHLEIKRLVDEERERKSEIQHATLEDVKRYDPKAKEIERIASKSSSAGSSPVAFPIPSQQPADAFPDLGRQYPFPVLGFLIVSILILAALTIAVVVIIRFW
ncbi:MAG: hypothetical protein KAV82_10410 [Phycisphaerae bacterium]|nr:hypothetical protein [Phycisphaerae bacterium]